MKMFMLKSFILAAIMFISVLAGMQIANNGIVQLKGPADPSLKKSVSLQDNETDLHTSVIDTDIPSHDLEAKKRKLAEISSFNFFSSMGKKMSDGISKASEKVIEKITE